MDIPQSLYKPELRIFPSYSETVQLITESGGVKFKFGFLHRVDESIDK